MCVEHDFCVGEINYFYLWVCSKCISITFLHHDDSVSSYITTTINQKPAACKIYKFKKKCVAWKGNSVEWKRGHTRSTIVCSDKMVSVLRQMDWDLVWRSVCGRSRRVLGESLWQVCSWSDSGGLECHIKEREIIHKQISCFRTMRGKNCADYGRNTKFVFKVD